MRVTILRIPLLVLVACSSPGTTDPGDDDPGDLLGTFSVSLVAPKRASEGSTTPGFTSIFGKVYDGVQPQTVVWTPQSTDGGCVLSTPHTPFCSPSCGAVAACVADNTCQPYPAAQSVGTVHVAGVKHGSSSEVDLVAVANSYQPPAGTVLDYPGFAEGDAIELTASGSSFTRSFHATARGVAAFELANADSLALQSSAALALAWTAPTNQGSEIAIKLDISHHGGSKGRIECALDDTGSLTIGAPMIDALLALGAAGYPSIIVTRTSTGHAAVATGHVDLVVSSEVEVPIAVPGVISCTDTTQCTPPATCQSDLTCK
jgi:hypothetical protein